MAQTSAQKFEFNLNFPSDMNALRLFKDGWKTRFPVQDFLGEFSAPRGEKSGFDDNRVLWTAEQLGGLHGRTVLEIGPFEGYNTVQLERLGAASILSIEANTEHFLKCLVVKNIFGLNAKFLLGDAEKYLDGSRTLFDLTYASGVLYHLAEPLQFLIFLSQSCDNLFIWTHYFQADTMRPSTLAFFDPARDRAVEYFGRTLRLHYRSYRHENFAGTADVFSGGAAPHANWMEKDDILHVLTIAGFKNIVFGHDDPRHANGPVCYFLASRGAD